MKSAILLLLVVTAVSAKHEQYAGWKSIIVKPNNQDQVKALNSKILDFELDFLSRSLVGREGVVLVKPQYQTQFLNLLAQEKIDYRIHPDDVKVQLDIDEQLIEARKLLTSSRNGGRIPYENYQSLDVIYDYIDKVAEENPDVVTLVNAGLSFEGRPLRYLKISNDKFESDKPVIFINGGINAREWISPPAVTYAIHKLVENVSDPELLERFNWILFPVANPDGYVYSFEYDRLWRKTRSTDQSPFGGICPGVDGNLNFDFFWNTVGTSSSPCSDRFPGSQAFSEVEVQAVDDIIQENLDNLILIITMHSYGSLILYPWGHDGSLSNQAFALHTVGTLMANAIAEVSLPHFPRYVVGNAALTLGYRTSGTAEDYAHRVGVPLAYTFVLPGLNDGYGGLHLDPSYIEQVVAETWVGVAVGVKRAGDLFRS